MSADTELADRVENLLHEGTQVHEGGINLTVAEVLTVEEPGRVDFGGGELEPAEVRPVQTTFRNEDDDYAWWHLEAGQYLVEYNESLAGGEPLLVQTRDELRARGAFHPTLRTADLGRVPLSVGAGGVRLKENARISTVVGEG